MPEKKTDPPLKVVADRAVPAKRFNLAAGAPGKVLKAIAPQARNRVFEGMAIAAHPVLRSVALAQDEEKEPLPVVSEKVDGEAALFKDRYDDNLRWYLPDFELVDPKEGAEALFTARQQIVTGPEGDDVARVEGAVRFAFERVMNEATEAALDSLKQKHPELAVKEIPLKVSEAKLTLKYWDDESEVERTEEFTAKYDQQNDEVHFNLKEARLKIAYANLSRNEGIELKLIGEYNGWERVAGSRSSEQTAEQTEERANVFPLKLTHLKPKMQVFSHQKATRGQTAIRSRRGKTERRRGAKVRDHRKTNVRDHRRKTTKVKARRGNKAKVRDHRREEVPEPKVRDHRRKRPKVRDHRRKTTKVRARRGKKAKVRDHRREEVPEPPEETFAKQRYIFEKTFQAVAYPCADYLHQYRLMEEETAQSFGCAPPWSDDFEQGRRYKRLTLPDSDLPVTIYESLAEPDTFLVIPDRYVITRTEDDGAPAVAMISAVDPEGHLGSSVTFEFAVAPDLSDFEQALLRQRLFEHTSRQDGVARPPVIELPSDLSRPAEVDFSDRFCTLVGSEPDGDNFLLALRCDPVKHALSVVSRLREKHAKLLGSLKFEIEDGIVESSALVLDLNKTTGPALQIARQNGTAVLSNVCESPVVVKGYLLHGLDGDAAAPQAFPESLTLAPGAEHTLLLAGDASAKLAIDYSVTEDTDLSLSERRIDVSEWHGTLVVDTNIDPEEHEVSSIRVELKFDAIEQHATCELIPHEGQFEHKLVDFVLPLDRYLDPDQRIVQYRAAVEFENGASPERRSEWHTHDLTEDGTNLTIKRDVLG